MILAMSVEIFFFHFIHRYASVYALWCDEQQNDIQMNLTTLTYIQKNMTIDRK